MVDVDFDDLHCQSHVGDDSREFELCIVEGEAGCQLGNIGVHVVGPEVGCDSKLGTHFFVCLSYLYVVNLIDHELNIDWLVTVGFFKAWHRGVKHGGSQLERRVGGDVGRVEPTCSAMDGEAGCEEAINGPGADETLDLGRCL